MARYGGLLGIGRFPFSLFFHPPGWIGAHYISVAHKNKEQNAMVRHQSFEFRPANPSLQEGANRPPPYAEKVGSAQ